jgi:hypothetical protein
VGGGVGLLRYQPNDASKKEKEQPFKHNAPSCTVEVEGGCRETESLLRDLCCDYVG